MQQGGAGSGCKLRSPGVRAGRRAALRSSSPGRQAASAGRRLEIVQMSLSDRPASGVSISWPPSHRRPSSKVYTTPTASTARPMGKKLKNPSGCRPAFWSSVLTTSIATMSSRTRAMAKSTIATATVANTICISVIVFPLAPRPPRCSTSKTRRATEKPGKHVRPSRK